MRVRIKNNRPDILWYHLKRHNEKDPLKIVDFIHPGDIIDRKIDDGVVELITHTDKGYGILNLGKQWRGWVPANTMEPINIGITEDGSIIVSFDETIVPDMSSTPLSLEIRYGCVMVGAIFLMGISYYVYSRYYTKKEGRKR